MGEPMVVPGASVLWRGDDVPLEVLDAAGCDLARLDADPALPGHAADRYCEGGGHPLIRALAAEMMARGAAGAVPVIGATPVLQTSLFRFFQSLPENICGRPIFVQLSHLPTDAARAFNRAAVASFAESCRAPPAALVGAIIRRNRLRQSLAKIDAMCAEHPPRLSGSDALELGHAYGSAAETDIESDLAARSNARAPIGVRVLIIGGLHVPAFYRALEDRGFQIVGEQVEFGVPSAPRHVNEREHPIDALAAAYGAPMPSVQAWKEAVQSRAAALGVQAVIFALPAYDHPTAWIVPILQAALTSQAVRTLVAPTDCFRDPHSAAASIASDWSAS